MLLLVVNSSPEPASHALPSDADHRHPRLYAEDQ